MNHFFKVVRCKSTGVFKAVPEFAKSGKKSKSVSVAVTALAVGLMGALPANAAIEDDVAANTAIIGQHTQALEQINGALENVDKLNQNIIQAGLIVGTADINEGSMAVGTEATASGDSAIAVGNETNVEGSQGLAVGSHNKVTGRQSTAIGSNNTIRGIEDWGNDELLIQESESSTLLGVGNNLAGRESVAIGVYNRAENNNVTITGGRNTVNSYDSGAYGQGNSVGNERVTPEFLRVDDGAALRRVDDGLRRVDDGDGLRVLPPYAIRSGSYAYGNDNEVVGNKTHAIGNTNSVMGESNGVLGNGNTLSNDSEFMGPPQWELRAAEARRRIPEYSNGSFLVGNQNDVTADSTHAVGNQNTIRNNRNVTVGSSNRVDFLEGPILNEPQRLRVVGDGDNIIQADGVYEEPILNQPQRIIGVPIEDNTSTAIVGEGNNIRAAGAHIVGTENTVNQGYSYVVGANNVVESGDSLMFGVNSMSNGSAVMGNKNSIMSQGTAALGDNNTVYRNSHSSTVSGTRNRIDGISSSVIGSENSTKKDVGGAFGTFNKVEGNYGIIGLIEDAMLEAEESDGIFPGIDIDGDGVIDIETREELEAFQASTLENGSYAYGNVNAVAGEAAHAVGNKNAVAGDNSGAFGNKNAIGTVGFYDQETETYIEPIKNNNTFAYGNSNVITKDGTHVTGNNNTVASANSVVSGNNNKSALALDPDAPQTGHDVIITGNDNINNSTDSVITGNKNNVQADNAFVFGSGNTVDVNAADSIILGSNASSTVAGGIAIGNNSVADRENAVSVGSAGAERQITNVADGTQDKDAVNLGQLNASIRDTTGGKNITATRTDTGYEVALNDAITLDSVTTGNTVVNTDGVKAGDVTLSSSTGLDNAGNRVTSVGDAILRSDAVNYGQFQDGLAGTIKSVTGDENITATTDAEKNVSLALNKNLVADSLTTGNAIISTDGLRAGDVFMSSTSGLDNAGFTVSGVGDAVERDEAINKGQFDDAIKDMITSVEPADDNVYVSRDGGSVWVGMSDNINVESVSTSGGSLDNLGLSVGTVTIDKETGINAGDMTVSGVANAVNRDEAINKGQFDDALAGISHTTVDGDSNIVVTKNDTGYDLSLSEDITVDSVTAGENVLSTGGLTIGGVTVNSETGINAGDMTVSGVSDAVNADDAVNLGQVSAIDDRLTAENVQQDSLIESNTTRITKNTAAIDKGLSVGDGTTANKFDLGDTVDITADSNTKTTTTENGVEIGLADNITIDSVTTGNALLNTNGLRVGDAMYGASGMRVGDVYFGPTGLRAGDVILSNTSGLNNAGFTISGVGDAVERDEAINKGQFDDALAGIKHTTVTGDANINATKNDTGYDLSLNKDLTVDSVTTGNTVVNGNGVAIGDVTLGAGGLNNGGNKVTGVAKATEGSDAVNLDQFNAALNDISPIDIKGDENITISKGSNGYEIGLNKDVAVDSVNAGGTIIDSNGVTVGDVTLSENGLNNAGNTITGVGAGVKDDDAVNMSQLNATNAKVDKNTADITATNDRITVETSRLDAKNDAQDKVIAGKLDREEFLQDQQRQDDAIKDKADQAELDKTNVNVSNNTTNIDKNAADIKDHATELDRLEDVKADKADLDETNENVTANADKNEEQDKALNDHQTELERLEDMKADKADINAKADTDYVDQAIDNKVEEQSSYFNEKVASYEAQINRDMEAIVKDQAKVDQAQDVRIDQNSQMISDLGYKVENLEGKLSAGIASTAAMALMPNAINPGEVRLTGGTSYYNGEGAIAVGLTGATETGTFTYKIAGSYTEEGGAVVGGGISYRVW